MTRVNPLQTGRFYKVKKPQRNFLCALCSAPRQMKYSKFLSPRNYLQILILSACLTVATFPLMGPKSIFLVFPVWMIWEVANKMLYRKEIPCPYCGFDATWYRRDVTVANKMVKEFWSTNYPELVNKSEQIEASEPQASEVNMDSEPETFRRVAER